MSKREIMAGMRDALRPRSPDFVSRLRLDVVRPTTVRSMTASILTILAVAYTLYFASTILIPVTLAIYLNLLLSPVVWALKKRGVPTSFSAALLVILLVGMVATALTFLSEPAQHWIEEAPRHMRALHSSVADVKEPLQNIQDISQEVKDITEIDAGGNDKVQKVAIKQPDFLTNLVEKLPTSVTSLSIAIFLTFFLLESSGSFGRKFARLGRTYSERRRIVVILHDMQASISRYLITITCINTLLGVTVTGLMYVMGFGDPWLWGVMAALLNFIPYVGPLIVIIILTFVGITTFGESPKVFVTPLAYLALATVEGQVLTPLIVGHRMELSPVAVFLSLVFWGWIWGPVGMFLAIPILAGIKIVLDKTPGIHMLASLLAK